MNVDPRFFEDRVVVVDLTTNKRREYLAQTDGSGRTYVLEDGDPVRVSYVNFGQNAGYVLQEQLRQDPGLFGYAAKFAQMNAKANGGQREV